MLSPTPLSAAAAAAADAASPSPGSQAAFVPPAAAARGRGGGATPVSLCASAVPAATSHTAVDASGPSHSDRSEGWPCKLISRA